MHNAQVSTHNQILFRPSRSTKGCYMTTYNNLTSRCLSSAPWPLPLPLPLPFPFCIFFCLHCHSTSTGKKRHRSNSGHKQSRNLTSVFSWHCHNMKSLKRLTPDVRIRSSGGGASM